MGAIDEEFRRQFNENSPVAGKYETRTDRQEAPQGAAAQAVPVQGIPIQGIPMQAYPVQPIQVQPLQPTGIPGAVPVLQVPGAQAPAAEPAAAVQFIPVNGMLRQVVPESQAREHVFYNGKVWPIF